MKFILEFLKMLFGKKKDGSLATSEVVRVEGDSSIILEDPQPISEIPIEELQPGKLTPKVITPKNIESSDSPTEFDVRLDNTRPWEFIMIHHSATKDGKNQDRDAIKRYHMSYAINGVIVSKEDWNKRKKAGEKGYFKSAWLTEGYHFYVEKVNGEIRLIQGRPVSMSGAHCYQKGMNKKSIGICCVGNFDDAPPEEVVLDMLAEFCRFLVRKYPQIKGPGQILAHRDFAKKSCPGKLFDMDKLKNKVNSLMVNRA